MALSAKLFIILFVIYVSIKLIKFYQKRKRIIQLIDKIPGPPNISFAPIINHALIILYLDSLKHKLGTFALTYYIMSTIHIAFPKEGICRFWLGLRPNIFVYSPETVESILVSTKNLNKGSDYSFFEPWIGEGLVTSKRNKWRFRRKILTPAFHFRILHDFLPIINREATKLIKKLNNRSFCGPDSIIDITQPVAMCTLDTICETAMGLNINCQDNEDFGYVQALHTVGETSLARITRPWLWLDFIFHSTDEGKRFLRAKNTMHEFTTRVIVERKEEWQKQLKLDSDALGTEKSFRQNDPLTLDQFRESSFFSSNNKRLAFLDLLLQQHLIENNMTIDDVREEVDTFMFAGHDTTAMNISWALYMLGLNQDIQQRAREELDRIIEIQDDDCEQFAYDDPEDEVVLAKKLKTTDITIEHIREMKYLDCIIKETLRMWPSIPFVARDITDDVLIANKYLIPKATNCIVMTHALHHNPKYYPKPEIFDPDRFTPENSANRHPFAYIPFSAGPRNCIGQRFAQMEVKVILAKVISNYYIETMTQRDKLTIVGELVLRSRDGLDVKLTPRFR